MLKKVIAMLLMSIMVLSGTVISFAEKSVSFTNVETIYIESEEDIREFMKTEEYDLNTKYTFIVENGKQQRRYCYNCGGPNMTSAIHYEETNVKWFACRYGAGMGSDTVAFFDILDVDSCRDCGLENIVELGIQAEVSCSTSFRDFLAEEGNTMSGGYDIHECLSTYM